MILTPKPPSDTPDGDLVLLPERRTMMVFALDLEADVLAPAVSSLTRRFWRHKLVFVHSSLDFRPFMTEKVAFETIPGFDQIAAFPNLVDWPRFLEDCRAMLVSKWSPRRAIAYGVTFPDYVQRASRIAKGLEPQEPASDG